MVNIFEELLSELDGGNVLDVATGEGSYITILQRYLHNFQSITGVDLNRKVLRTAQDITHIPGIQFIQMNAELLGFNSGTFDMVNISASLHHLENVSRVLAEMVRVMKSGGKFILTEMHRDGTSEEQFNAIRIHHWAAAVDSSQGILHDRTFARQEILEFIRELNLVNLTTRDIKNTNTNPQDEKTIAAVRAYIDRYHQRLVRGSGSQALLEQEAELRASLEEKGFQQEPVLLVIAEKA